MIHSLLCYWHEIQAQKHVEQSMVFVVNGLSMINLSLNSQNRLFPYSGIRLLMIFLVFHPVTINFVKPEACAIIFSTASRLFKLTKERNKKKCNVVCVDIDISYFLLNSELFLHKLKSS